MRTGRLHDGVILLPRPECQNAFLFKFVFSLGNKKTIGEISLTIEATNKILVFVVNNCKWAIVYQLCMHYRSHIYYLF